MDSVLEKELQHQSSTPNKLDIHYLRTITKNFSEHQILGHGGFGIVYKGEKENGEVVAVKKLNMSTAAMDDKQFMNEVKHAMYICHPNIVRLEGYCYHTEKEVRLYNGSYVFVDEIYRLLCFEYLPNGSLDKYLSDESSGLDWHMRYNIIDGICNGLHCLHESRKGAPILHLDLKPSNILLDENMIPKIADFGLSRLFDDEKTHTCTMNVTGTRGYMAPEYIDRFVLSKKSDIFSLGVIIIEIVTGHRKYPKGTTSEELTEVYEKWRRRLQTTSNKTSLEEECRQVNQCIEVGMKCMEYEPKTRPNIREIVEIFKSEKWRRRLQTTSNKISVEEECRQVNQCIEVGMKCMDYEPKRRPNTRESVENFKISENTNSYSVTGDGSHAEEESRESELSSWSEALNVLASEAGVEQCIEAMKVILHELNGPMDNTSWVVPQFIIKDSDKLVSHLTLMVHKSFLSSLTGPSLCKHTLNTLLQIVGNVYLAHAVKEDTLEKLVAELLIRLSNADDVVRKLEGAALLKALNILMLKILDNADRTLTFVILINFLRPLNPSTWTYHTPLELLAGKENIFSDLVVKCLIKLTKALQSTVDTIDLDRVLQSIHAYFEPLGMEEIRRRASNGDKPLRLVKTVVHELVKLTGSKIKDHLTMVPTDAEPRPIILAYIDLDLQTLPAARWLESSSLPMGQTHGADAATNSTTTSTHSSPYATENTNSTLEMLPEKMSHTHLEAEKGAAKEKGSTSQPRRRAQQPRTKEKGPKRWVS